VTQILEFESSEEGLRNETELERMDRNFNELLSELRVVATGVQVLFAFLLIVPFSVGFSHLSQGGRYAYFAILLATAAAAGFLIAPSALHRLIFRRGDKPYLVDAANAMAIGGIACLMLAMTGILTLLSGHLFGWIAGVIVAIAAASFFGSLWFGLGLMRRRQL
jgi:hypothetical protein